MLGEDHVRMPLGADRTERATAWAGGEVDFEGREVLLVTRAATEPRYDWQHRLDRFWPGLADDFDVFTPAGDLYSFIFTFAPDGYKYRSIVDYDWSELLVKYGDGGDGTDADLRAEQWLRLYETVWTCVNGERLCEGLIASHANGMARLMNEIRRRILKLPT